MAERLGKGLISRRLKESTLRNARPHMRGGGGGGCTAALVVGDDTHGQHCTHLVHALQVVLEAAGLPMYVTQP